MGFEHLAGFLYHQHLWSDALEANREYFIYNTDEEVK